MNLSDYMNAINKTKDNVIALSASPDAAAKAYPAFVVARSLSYYPTTIMYVNELNRYPVANKQHFEFLLNIIPTGRRYQKWSKPEKSDIIKLLVDTYGLSYDKAKDTCRLLTDSQIEELKKEPNYGGVTK